MKYGEIDFFSMFEFFLIKWINTILLNKMLKKTELKKTTRQKKVNKLKTSSGLRNTKFRKRNDNMERIEAGPANATYQRHMPA